MSKKKKREYGIPNDDFTISDVISDDCVIWDMHSHIDMIVHHEAGVVAEVNAKRMTEIAENGVARTPEVLTTTPTKIVDESVSAGIRGIVHCACEMSGIERISTVIDEIQNVTPNVVGAAAIHPNESVLHYAAHNSDYELETAPDGLEPPKIRDYHRKYSLEDCIAFIENLAKTDERIKIIGETGLDYFRTSENGASIQKQSLNMHIELAKLLGLPVQIHDREAHDDICEILSTQKPEKALFHSFSGDINLAKTCIENGWWTSFSGPITFNANNDLREAFKYLYANAPELLLIETDAPFLTPMPYRGRTNTPARIAYTLTYMAKMLCDEFATESEINQKIVELSEIFSQNSLRVIY